MALTFFLNTLPKFCFFSLQVINTFNDITNFCAKSVHSLKSRDLKKRGLSFFILVVSMYSVVLHEKLNSPESFMGFIHKQSPG